MTQCVFARQVWCRCFAKAGVDPNLNPLHHDFLQPWWMNARKHVSSTDKKGFDALVMLICRTLWKQRNARVFHSGAICNELETVTLVFQELQLWKLAGVVGVQRFCE